ncbi:oligosaccharide flippase family protein [Robiginitomaculum antarcticum]|uniref:oligosaccharide flippase family protein n=1 Tax=Robiginitomaculum antarcticum TaxID=437507 RepID=UPI00036C0565|nr:oligosaccharide flippase family protein [Robiginitomaculum antarcticum]
MKFTRHLIGYAPVKILAMLCSFGGIYLYTRLLSPEDYGRYALMFSVMALIHMLSLTWVEASSYRMGGEYKTASDRANHFRTATTLMLASLGVTALLLTVLFFFSRNAAEYRNFIPFMAVIMPLNTLIKIAMEAHRAQQNVKRFMLSAMAKLAIGFSVGVLLAWKSGLGALAPFAGLATGAVILACVEGRWVLAQALKGQTESKTMRRWMAFGIPAAFALGLDLMLSSADRFLIAYYMGEAAVGSYAAGYGVADKTVVFLISWIAMAGSPLLMEAFEKGDQALLNKRAKDFAILILVAGLPVATGIALVANPLADAMIGESLRSSAKSIIPWIAFSGLLNGVLAFYVSESFHLVKKMRLKAVLMIFPLALNIILNVMLIPIYGLMGAVSATLISYIFAVILVGAIGRKHVALPIPFKEAALIMMACGAMYPVKFIALGFGPWVDLFAMAACGAIIYTVIIGSFDIAGVRGWARKTLGAAA